MALVVVAFLAPAALPFESPVFWLESAAILAFGAAWFVKGRTVLADVEGSSERA